jgi:hypothetical protein
MIPKTVAIFRSFVFLSALSVAGVSSAQPSAPAGWKFSASSSANTTYVTVEAENAIMTVAPPLTIQSLDQMVDRIRNMRPNSNCGNAMVEKANPIGGIKAKLIPMTAGTKYQCSILVMQRDDGEGQVIFMASLLSYDHIGKTETTAIAIAQQLATTGQNNSVSQRSAQSNNRSASTPKSSPAVTPSQANDIAMALQTLAPMLDKDGATSKGIKTSDIDSIRFDMFDLTSIRPLILLKNKIVCDCAEFVLEEIDLAAVARKTPNDIGQWRLDSSGKVQIKWTKSKDWSGLSFPDAKGKPLGDNWKGNGTYKRISTSGYGMAGGENSAMTSVSTMLTFSPDGRFSEGSVISSTVEGSGSRTFAGGQSAAKSGRYKVEGWNLVLTYDNGKIEKSAAIIDKEPTTIWLAGKSYVR